MGIASLFIAAFYAGMLILIYTTEDTRRKKYRIVALVSLPLTTLCIVALLALVEYGSSYQMAAMGLPPVVIVPVAEVFAVLCEAVLLRILHKNALPLGQAGVTSLLMNATSLFLGFWIFGIWP
jgi:cytochrome bd-type quinol oxidase subunit 2